MRLATVIALGKIGDTAVVPYLTTAVEDIDSDIGRAAQGCLYRITNATKLSYATSTHQPKNMTMHKANVKALEQTGYAWIRP